MEHTNDIYQKDYTSLTEDEKVMWSTALKVLQEGDTLYHTNTSHWGWALSYARSLLEPHPQAVMYAELLKDENGYGIAFIRIAEQTPEAPG